MWTVIQRGAAVALALTTLAMAGVAQDAPTPPPAPEVSPEEAWKQRMEEALARVEVALNALDLKKTTPIVELSPRVSAAHKRLAELERAAQMTVGVIRGKNTKADLSADVASLTTRARVLTDARRPTPKTPPTPKPSPPPKPKVEASPDKRGGWPTSIQFKATAKVVYEEVGEWLYGSKSRRSSLGNDFLMNGYQGVLSFSLSSNGLKHEVASADIRVVISQKAPFAYDGQTYWVYDVTWSSTVSQAGTFGNGSLKHYTRHAEVYGRGPIVWIAKPKEVTMSLPVEAHLTAVRLKSGEEIQFDAPTFSPK